MFIRSLFLLSILVPQFVLPSNSLPSSNLSKDSINSMSSDEFLSFATCASMAEILEQVDFKTDREFLDLTERRKHLRAFIANSDKEIQQALSEHDTYQASMVCAWVDDLTLGFSIACPSDEDPEKDLVSEATFTACQRLSRK